MITTGKKGRKIVIALKAFLGNPYDVHTIAPLLEQIENNKLPLPEELAYDRGGKGKKQIKGVNIITPDKPKDSDSVYQKRRKRRQCRSRAAIEPIIGHLKKDFRMEQNYLWGEKGIQINAMMAATAWNLKRMPEKLKKEFLFFVFKIFFRHEFQYAVA